jgi:phage-related baseplate assembly protein
MNIVDLSTLSAPDVLEVVDFEDIYTEQLGVFTELMGDGYTAPLESDPAVKLLEVAAYRKMGNRARVNDAAKALMLPYSKDKDLEQLAARVNLKRLVVQEEDATTVPPTQRVMEEDDALRERIQLRFEGLTTAGPRQSYILHARNASGLVADATAESPSPATVVLTILGLQGDGSVGQELLDDVATYVSDDDVRPLGDRLIVKGAQILPYSITAILHPDGTGAESELMLAEARKRLKAWVNPRRRLGIEVARSAVDAQLHIAGVRRVELVGWQDLTPSKEQAAYCTGYDVQLGV